MVIPSSDNNECGTLICGLHSLAHRYKYGAYRKRKFPEMVEFFIEKDNYTIPQMVKATKKEIRSAIFLNTMDYRISEYKDTLNEFRDYMMETYVDEYPEIGI
jgi:hypothetical protein